MLCVHLVSKSASEMCFTEMCSPSFFLFRPVPCQKGFQPQFLEPPLEPPPRTWSTCEPSFFYLKEAILWMCSAAADSCSSSVSAPGSSGRRRCSTASWTLLPLLKACCCCSRPEPSTSVWPTCSPASPRSCRWWQRQLSRAVESLVLSGSSPLRET